MHTHVKGDRRPEHKKLNRILVHYCNLWQPIGLHLGLTQAQLNVIAADHPMDQKECFRKTLYDWLQMDIGATWSTLELAITNAKREDLGFEPLDTSKIHMYISIHGLICNQFYN